MLAKKGPRGSRPGQPGRARLLLRNPSGFRVHVVLSSITGLTMEGRTADVERPDEDGIEQGFVWRQKKVLPRALARDRIE